MSIIENKSVELILIKQGKLTDDQLQDALKTLDTLKTNIRLSGTSMKEIPKVTDILLDRKLITSRDVAEALAELLNIPFFNTKNFNKKTIDINTAKLLREGAAKDIECLVINKNPQGKYLVVSTDPSDMRTKIKLKTLLRIEIPQIDFRVISKDEFNELFNEIYNLNLSIAKIRKEKEEENKNNVSGAFALDDRSDISNIIDTILSTAIAERASDIHIESIENNVIVRYRIDTVPVVKYTFPQEIEAMLIQKFYLQCGLPVDRKNTPLDGRFEKTYNGKTYDFRVNFLPSYLPTRNVSKISIRILNRESAALSISQIGFTDTNLTTYNRLMTEPHGLVLVVGPMGSGKTTTLYSTIGHLNPKDKIIVTLEDPPEFSIEYVNQCKINPEVGFTYEMGLKAILRQDADIILVGEIRDSEVGKLAIQSAEIGRLVFSTLHVDNAVASILRLNNLGIAPFFVSSVLVGVVSQRLARRICPHCSTEYVPSDEDLLKASAMLQKDVTHHKFKRGTGCQKCNGTGYLGLIPIHEVLNFKEITPLKEAVSGGVLSVDALTQLAVEHGYRPMVFDAFDKIYLGETTFEEIDRVVIDANGRKVIEFMISKIKPNQQ